MGNVDRVELDREIDDLRDELLAVVGDDDDLQHAARTVAAWAWRRSASVGLCRRGLIDGRAYELDCLRADAGVLEQQAAALRLLIAHTEATNPRARRRRRKQHA